MNEITQISTSEYELIRDLVYDRFGINLGDKKKSLVIGRLHKVLRQYGFENFKEYYDSLLKDKTGEALTELVDRISTNHTYFYREFVHYEYFVESALPQIIQFARERGENEIRIWSAGCSSGEEPYNLAMLIKDNFSTQLGKMHIKILATDISTSVLEKAVKGEYARENVEKLPRKLLNKYFRKVNKDKYEVNAEIKSMITFRKLNLMMSNFPFSKSFHCTFCRNVMIYFDQQTRDTLVSKFANHMISNGYLFIGHSESLGRSNPHFNYLKPAVYQKLGI